MINNRTRALGSSSVTWCEQQVLTPVQADCSAGEVLVVVLLHLTNVEAGDGTGSLLMAINTKQCQC